MLVLGVRVSVTFHLTCVHIILGRIRLLSDHLLGNSCSLGWPYVLFCILTICSISYFPIWFWGLELGSDCFSSRSLHTFYMYKHQIWQVVGSLLPVSGVRVSITFHLMCEHIILVLFRFLSGHLLGNSCSLGWPYVFFVFWLLVILFISRFGFEGWNLVMTVLVPDICIRFYFCTVYKRISHVLLISSFICPFSFFPINWSSMASDGYQWGMWALLTFCYICSRSFI